jgi:hypothetical protein
MSSENVPLTPIPSSSTAGPRGSTPSKIAKTVVGGATSPTHNTSPLPARPNSNPRSSSNPRTGSNSRPIKVIQAMNSIEKIEENLSQRHQNRSLSSRAISRRKQRRWENMNLFGIQEVLAPHVVQEMLEQKDNEPILNKYLFPLDVKDKKSAFEELLVNQQLLSIFRHCEEQFYFSTPSISNKHKSIEDKCWSNVEKKIRSVIISSIQQNMKHFQFLLQMEKLLFAFIHRDLPSSFSSVDSSTASSSSSSSVSSSLALPQFHPMICSYSLLSEEKGGHLQVELGKESPFHRLLFHGICQFYGLKSQVRYLPLFRLFPLEVNLFLPKLEFSD